MQGRPTIISLILAGSVIVVAVATIILTDHRPLPVEQVAAEAVTDERTRGNGGEIITIEQRDRALGLRGDI